MTLQARAAFVDSDYLKGRTLLTNCSSSKKIIVQIPVSSVRDACFRDAYGIQFTPIEFPAATFFGLAGNRRANTEALLDKYGLAQLNQQKITVASSQSDGQIEKFAMFLPVQITNWEDTHAHFRHYYEAEGAIACYMIEHKTLLSGLRKSGSALKMPKDIAEQKGVREYITLTPKEEAKKDPTWRIVNTNQERERPKTLGRKPKTKALCDDTSGVVPAAVQLEETTPADSTPLGELQAPTTEQETPSMPTATSKTLALPNLTAFATGKKRTVQAVYTLTRCEHNNLFPEFAEDFPKYAKHAEVSLEITYKSA